MRDPGLREHRRAELMVGALVLVAAFVLGWGIIFLSEADLGGGLRVYGTSSDAGQITGGARIYLLGVDVGSVRRVQLDGRRVVLTLDIRYEGTLPADTRGQIVPSGFLGSQMVQLLPGTGDRPLAPGDTIPLGRVPDLQALVGDLGDQATVLLEEAANLVSEETAEEIRTSSSALAAAMQELRGLIAEQRSTLTLLLDGLSATSRNLAEATSGGELQRTMARLDSLTEKLQRAGGGLDSTSHALASILTRIDEGQGSLGRLVQDDALYEQVAAAMENLQAASEEIALLSKDLRERPDRYLKGLKFSVF